MFSSTPAATANGGNNGHSDDPQKQITHLESLLSGKAKTIKTLEIEITTLKSRLEQTEQKLQREIDGHQEAFSSHIDQGLSMMGEMEKNKELIRILQARVGPLQLEIMVLRSLMREKAATLRKQLQAQRRDLQALKQTVAQQQQTLASNLFTASRGLQHAQATHGQLNNLLQAKQKKLKLILPAVREALAEIKKLEKEREDLQRENFEANNRAQALQLLLTRTQAREKELLQQLHDEKTKTADAHLEVPTLQFQIQQLQEENETLKLQPQTQNQKLETEIAALKQQTQQQEHTQLQALNRELLNKVNQTASQELAKTSRWKKWALIGSGSLLTGGGGFTLAALGYASALWNPIGLIILTLLILITAYCFHEAKHSHDQATQLNQQKTLSTTAQLSTPLGGDKGLTVNPGIEKKKKSKTSPPGPDEGVQGARPFVQRDVRTRDGEKAEYRDVRSRGTNGRAP